MVYPDQRTQQMKNAYSAEPVAVFASGQDLLNLRIVKEYEQIF